MPDLETPLHCNKLSDQLQDTHKNLGTRTANIMHIIKAMFNLCLLFISHTDK